MDPFQDFPDIEDHEPQTFENRIKVSFPWKLSESSFIIHRRRQKFNFLSDRFPPRRGNSPLPPPPTNSSHDHDRDQDRHCHPFRCSLDQWDGENKLIGFLLFCCCCCCSWRCCSWWCCSSCARFSFVLSLTWLKIIQPPSLSFARVFPKQWSIHWSFS